MRFFHQADRSGRVGLVDRKAPSPSEIPTLAFAKRAIGFLSLDVAPDRNRGWCSASIATIRNRRETLLAGVAQRGRSFIDDQPSAQEAGPREDQIQNLTPSLKDHDTQHSFAHQRIWPGTNRFSGPICPGGPRSSQLYWIPAIDVPARRPVIRGFDRFEHAIYLSASND